LGRIGQNNNLAPVPEFTWRPAQGSNASVLAPSMPDRI